MRRGAILLAAAGAMLALGCQTTEVSTSDGRPFPPKPRRAPDAPAGAVANRMILIVGQRADDSDGNGYPDQIPISVGLFAEPHPIAIACEGEFRFRLYRQGDFGRPDVEPIAEWRIDAETARGLLGRKPWGMGYDLRLNILDVAEDAMPSTPADLRGSFVPAATGERIEASDEVRPVRIGRS